MEKFFQLAAFLQQCIFVEAQGHRSYEKMQQEKKLQEFAADVNFVFELQLNNK